jgi:hypothetical protein
MGALESILRNFIVQIFLGIGAMVFLITIGEAIRSSASKRGNSRSKEEEEKMRSEFRQELGALREEMQTMKSILLEHSMSLDANVENLKNRIEHVERILPARDARNA